MQHSGHRIELRTLPARFWKWRMRGAALHFARAVAAPEHYDLLLVTDLMGVADLKALWGARCPPIVLYLHENQLSYPVPAGERMDFQFGFTDIASALAADVMVFNSHYHRDAYFAALPRFLRRMPEHVPKWVPAALEPKARVLYPGCRLPRPQAELPPAEPESRPDPKAADESGAPAAVPPPVTREFRPGPGATARLQAALAEEPAPGAAQAAPPDPATPAAVPATSGAAPRRERSGARRPDAESDAAQRAAAPLVIWNHRWEFDKQPAVFFAALRQAQEAGVAFRVALLGENFQVVPQEFEAARGWLGERLIQYGYVPSRAAYRELLQCGSVVVSTAIQENFGISVVEAVAAGNHPLLPRRLSYPEVIPAAYHDACLYADDAALTEMLIRLLAAPPVAAPRGLAAAMQRYSWCSLAAAYDALFAEYGRSLAAGLV